MTPRTLPRRDMVIRSGADAMAWLLDSMRSDVVTIVTSEAELREALASPVPFLAPPCKDSDR